MRKVSKVNGLNGLELEHNITSVIEEQLNILDESYGTDRNVEADLGGYIVILENRKDIRVLKQDKLQWVVPEYTDLIECKEGVNWTSSLFLLSSDYSIVVVCTEELSKYLIER